MPRDVRNLNPVLIKNKGNKDAGEVQPDSTIAS